MTEARTERTAAASRGYPADWEADVLASDGATVHVRPIRPDDADALVALHARFSDRTRYLRYFSPYPRIPPRDLERFVNVDHHDREAFVACSADEIIAVGRYERLGPAGGRAAEVAFVVEDAYQGRGIGSVLLEHLAAAARENGLTRFVAEVLPENRTMLRVFADAGYQVSREFADGVVHLKFPIAPTERSVAVRDCPGAARRGAHRSRGCCSRGGGRVRRRDGPARGRRGGAAQRAARRLHRCGVPGPPEASTVGGCRAYPRRRTPRPGRPRGGGGAGGRASTAVAGRARGGARRWSWSAPGSPSRGRTGPGRAAAGHGGPRPRHARGRPELPRRGQHRPGRAPQRHAGPGPAAGRPGRHLLPVGRGRRRDARRGRAARARACPRSSRPATGPTCPATTCCSTGRRPRTDVVLLYLETFGNPRKFARIARGSAGTSRSSR